MIIRRIYSLLAGAVILISVCSMVPAIARGSGVDSKKIKVTANEGAFTPSVIRAPAHSNYILSIFAKDKDYPFAVPDVGVNMTIKKGTSIDIEIGSFGVGKHLFSCGSNCGGYIELEIVSDDDDAQ